jgi:hypothetical protein
MTQAEMKSEITRLREMICAAVKTQMAASLAAEDPERTDAEREVLKREEVGAWVALQNEMIDLEASDEEREALGAAIAGLLAPATGATP